MTAMLTRTRPRSSRSAVRPTRADRIARGLDARTRAPLESHAEFVPATDRDPVGLLLSTGGDAGTRARADPLRPDAGSPFAYYRGAALLMAADLAEDAEIRTHRAALRRRPPVQLRRVRLA